MRVTMGVLTLAQGCIPRFARSLVWSLGIRRAWAAAMRQFGRRVDQERRGKRFYRNEAASVGGLFVVRGTSAEVAG
jgi:hypothetical protein